MASVGSILGGAFGLLRERPGAVAIWAVTYCVGSLVVSMAMSAAMFGALTPSSADSARMMEIWMGPTFSLILLLNLVLLLLAVVLMNAVFRAMLRPEEGGFAFMRVGMDEFRMLGLVILVIMAAFIALFVGELVLLLLIGILAFTLGQSMITAALSFLLGLAFLCALVWAEVRLSLPDQRRCHLGSDARPLLAAVRLLFPDHPDLRHRRLCDAVVHDGRLFRRPDSGAW
jgi:hypothetical protein